MQRSSRALINKLFFDKMNTATKDFLLTNKLVTKSFNGLDRSQTPEYDTAGSKCNLKLVFRILLVNIKKILPILKAESEVYKVPFCSFFLREIIVVLTLTNITEQALRKYFDKVGITAFLSKYSNPNGITITSGTWYDPTEDIPVVNEDPPISSTQEETSITTIKVSFSNGSRLMVFTALLFDMILHTREILEVLQTLHRKALFK
jgi:hypothetical protein